MFVKTSEYTFIFFSSSFTYLTKITKIFMSANGPQGSVSAAGPRQCAPAAAFCPLRVMVKLPVLRKRHTLDICIRQLLLLLRAGAAVCPEPA